MTVSLLLGITLVVGAAGYVGLAAYVWRHRQVPGAPALTALLLAVGTWSICYALELSSTTVDAARWWAGLKFVGIVALAPAMWSFVLNYTGSARGLPRRVLVLLLVQPALVLTLLAVPATHDLVHYYPVEVPGSDTPQRYLGASPLAQGGELFWWHAIYTYVLTLGAVLLLVVRLSRIARPYRRQAVAMMVASVLPLIGNVMYNGELLGLGVLDPTPFLFSLTAAVLVWGFFRLRLLGLMRVARTVVVDRLADAVLVTDMYGRIADLNPATERLLGASRADLVGVRLVDRLGSVGALLRDRARGEVAGEAELVLDLPQGPVDAAVQVTKVFEIGRESGHVVVLRDISDRKSTERRLRELLAEQTRIAETLQTGLRPATLPVVPGLDLAARSVPAGGDGPLSGDFYDVHPCTAGRWAFVLGDVSGKGVHAAVVTSMARYTVRTLSAQGLSPAEVLRRLNLALLSDDLERFCTVVYGVLAPSPQGGVDVTLALGGHPSPLLRRHGDVVAPVGRPGTALGLMPHVEVREETLRLAAGDVLLAYTDGVTEARRPHGEGEPAEQLGEERLARALARAPAGADAVADHVLTEVDAFAAQRDDVAVLVIVAR